LFLIIIIFFLSFRPNRVSGEIASLSVRRRRRDFSRLHFEFRRTGHKVEMTRKDCLFNARLWSLFYVEDLREESEKITERLH
jgi:hypothetical protein